MSTLILYTALLLGADWSANPILWQSHDDGFTATVNSHSFAVSESNTNFKKVFVSTDVIVRETLGEEWKIVGVSVYRDYRNFWHFAMIESPNDAGKTRRFELSEMRDGAWLAQSNLKCMADEQWKAAWKPGEAYHLSIALDAEGVEGIAKDSAGKIVRRVRYAFDAEAVTSGRPALRCNGFQANFRGLQTKTAEPMAVEPRVFPPYRSMRCLPDVHGKRTGFFHVQRQGKTWAAIDPEGRGFLPLGVDHVRFEGHFCEALGYGQYGKNNREKYPDEEAWAKETLSRLEDWGFNLIAAGGSPCLYRRGAAHVHFLALGEQFTRLGDDYAICEAQGIPCSAFPNVFHPDFGAYCEYATRSLDENKNDPWLFGYFLDNELRWWGEEGFEIETGLFNTVMKKPAAHTAKRALVAFLKERYDGNIDRFNKAWKLSTPLDSFEALLRRDSLPDITEPATEDKKAFVALTARRYFEITTAAIRRRDPNHMILGCRFAGGYASEGAWKEAGKCCDVISFNYYGNVNLEHGVAMNHDSPWTGKTLREAFARFYKMGGRPMMTTEWSFPALDAGLPSVHGAGQRFETQAERTEATRIFAETILRMPFMIGYDFFMWVDEPELGISKKFPEDSNYGLVSEEGKPYPEITAMFTRLHANAARLRSEGFASPPTETPLQPADSGGTEPPQPFAFSQNGPNYRAVAGKWKLEGTIGPGPFWSKVTYDDVSLGWYNGMVSHKPEKLAWNEVTQVTRVKPIGPLKNPTAIDLTGRYESPEASFELTQRFTFHPDRDAFTIQLISCKNISAKPLFVKGFFFRPHSAIGSAATDDRPIKEKTAPRLWGAVQGDAWQDAAAGVYWGLAVPQGAPAKFYFWLNEQGGQHPDARWEMDVEIAPGETFRPDRSVYVVSVAGRGDRMAWEKKVRLVLRTIAVPKRTRAE